MSYFVVLHQARELLLSRGLAVLGSWALLNLLLSGYRIARLDRRSEAYSYHLMNVGWGFVNAVLAALGIVRLHPGQVSGITLGSLLSEQLDLSYIFLFNGGLDVAYVMTGYWLRARAEQAATEAQQARFLGFGRSLWLQGGFLLLFDLGMWLLLRPLTFRLLEQIP